jgi:hypothetical protein
MEIANDKYELWDSIAADLGTFYFFELHNESGFLVIHLKKFGLENEVLRITFDGIIAYQVVQEAGRLKTINDNPSLSTFNISTDSRFLKWIKEESGGIFDDAELVHYVICNSDNIIDVISGPPVKVEWIKINL